MTFLGKLKNRMEELADEASRFVATPELQKERIAICNSCEFLFELTRNCKACGCFVDAKTRLAPAKCPKAKW